MDNNPSLAMNDEAAANTIRSIADLIEDIHWAWQRLSTARNIVEQSDAVDRLGNAVSQLSTWHPAWDYERGVIWNEDDLEDFYLAQSESVPAN